MLINLVQSISFDIIKDMQIQSLCIYKSFLMIQEYLMSFYFLTNS
ncbi:unnamed protein product [Paramecium pentaurelia]|uniref:Uncharacterized protein n=1 Tax=Paramecium pentaurelia TaxID=43138 RepID=A0A8S1XFC5_9CILI|nr:unnamed protein product [Paramecium pentaurelia]